MYISKQTLAGVWINEPAPMMRSVLLEGPEVLRRIYNTGEYREVKFMTGGQCIGRYCADTGGVFNQQPVDTTLEPCRGDK